MKFIFLVSAGVLISIVSVAQENPYDLLSSLDSSSSFSDEEALKRSPASERKDQIEVRTQLPEAKQRKTAKAIQWEVLHKKAAPEMPANSSSDHGD